MSGIGISTPAGAEAVLCAAAGCVWAAIGLPIRDPSITSRPITKNVSLFLKVASTDWITLGRYRTTLYTRTMPVVISGGTPRTPRPVAETNTLLGCIVDFHPPDLKAGEIQDQKCAKHDTQNRDGGGDRIRIRHQQSEQRRRARRRGDVHGA